VAAGQVPSVARRVLFRLRRAQAFRLAGQSPRDGVGVRHWVLWALVWAGYPGRLPPSWAAGGHRARMVARMVAGMVVPEHLTWDCLTWERRIWLASNPWAGPLSEVARFALLRCVLGPHAPLLTDRELVSDWPHKQTEVPKGDQAHAPGCDLDQGRPGLYLASIAPGLGRQVHARLVARAARKRRHPIWPEQPRSGRGISARGGMVHRRGPRRAEDGQRS
jgi:hypothetical protein